MITIILLITLNILIIGLIIVLVNISAKKSFKRTRKPEIQPPHKEIDYKTSYQKKYLLTRNEWYEWKKLQKAAETNDFLVFPKVRLLDIIEPRRDAKEWKTLFYKIQAKHIDFLICDKKAHIKIILELDDASHNNAERQERDRFVDEIVQSVGYKIIRTRGITDEVISQIAKTVNDPQTKSPG